MSRRSQIQRYLRIPFGNVRKVLALSEALLTAVPDDASSTVTAAAADLQISADDLGGQYDRRQQAPTGGRREFNYRSDRAWSALYHVLYGAARVPLDDAHQKQAQELLDTLFPDGLSFLALSYRDQWVESERRLKRVQDKKLAGLLAEVTGHARYLDVVRATHEDFGKALNITEAAPIEERPNLTQGIANVRQAMSYYVVQVVAWGQAEGGRNLKQAYLALRPIDVAREAMARATASSAQGEGEKAEGAPVDTEPVDTEPVDTEPVDTEPVDTEPVDAEAVDAEAVDAEAVDAEPVDAEPVDAEAVDAEAVDAEAVDVEAVDAGAADAEAAGAEAADAENSESGASVDSDTTVRQDPRTRHPPPDP